MTLWGAHFLETGEGDGFTVSVEEDVHLPDDLFDRLSYHEAIGSLQRDATATNEAVSAIDLPAGDRTHVIIWDAVAVFYDLDYPSRHAHVWFVLVDDQI